MAKSPHAFRTISEVAAELGVRQHVLRFWESKFSQIKPMKRGGGRRYYRPDDVDLLKGICRLLYGEGYSIRGVQKILRQHGARAVTEAVRSGGDMIAHITHGAAPTDGSMPITPEAPATAPAANPTGDDAPSSESMLMPAAMERTLRAVLAELQAARAVLSEPD